MDDNCSVGILRHIKRPPAALLLGIIEFIPAGDFLPIWTIMVVGMLIYNNFLRLRQRKKIKKMKKLTKAFAARPAQ